MNQFLPLLIPVIKVLIETFIKNNSDKAKAMTQLNGIIRSAEKRYLDNAKQHDAYEDMLNGQ